MNFLRRLSRSDLAAVLVLTATVALLFLGAPAGGAFYWSDAPRHALNGVFVLDFLRAMPIDDPSGYAYRYYAQYPALTILFYPSIFYVLSAPFYWAFGVSHETALFVVAIHYVALAWGCYRLARFWLEPFDACAVGLLVVVAPEVAFWGRQVMLEIPALAYLVWSAVFLTSYRRTGKPLQLYACAALLVLSIYTKLTAAFAGGVYLAVLFWERRTALLRDGQVKLVLALTILALLPLLALTLTFGWINVQSAVGVADTAVSRASLGGWLWYLRQIPEQIGWLAALAALVGVGALCTRADRLRLERGDLLFWMSWVLVGYVFFSAIDLKASRYSLFILPLLLLAAVVGLRALLPGTMATLVVLSVTLATAAQTVVQRPVFYVEGYAEAVDYVAREAPRDSVILFSGYRDGAFVFNLREREDRRDLSVLRADKLLLRVAVRRELGVEQKALSEEEISHLIDRSGVYYVVAQPGFWNDLEVMRRFEALLQSAHFKEVARIPMHANFLALEKELVVYRNLGPVNPGPIHLQLELPIIDRTIEATVGKRDSSTP